MGETQMFDHCATRASPLLHQLEFLRHTSKSLRRLPDNDNSAELTGDGENRPLLYYAVPERNGLGYLDYLADWLVFPITLCSLM